MTSESAPNKVEINPVKSFRWNFDAGCSKDDLMKYYGIESEEKWEKLMKSIEQTKLQEDAKKFRRKMIMGKGAVENGK